MYEFCRFAILKCSNNFELCMDEFENISDYRIVGEVHFVGRSYDTDYRIKTIPICTNIPELENYTAKLIVSVDERYSDCINSTSISFVNIPGSILQHSIELNLDIICSYFTTIVKHDKDYLVFYKFCNIKFTINLDSIKNEDHFCNVLATKIARGIFLKLRPSFGCINLFANFDVPFKNIKYSKLYWLLQLGESKL